MSTESGLCDYCGKDCGCTASSNGHGLLSSGCICGFEEVKPVGPGRCGIDDHKWKLIIDCGSPRLECVDRCDIDPDTYDYSQKTLPACWWVPDCMDFAYGEFDVKPIYSSTPDWETGVHDDPQMDLECIGCQKTTRKAQSAYESK